MFELEHRTVAGQDFYIIVKVGWKAIWGSKSKQYALRKWRKFVASLVTQGDANEPADCFLQAPTPQH